MLRRFRVKYILGLFLAATLCGAADTYETGRELYFAKGCNGCHGVKAEGVHEYPALAKRDKEILVRKLEQFRSGVSMNQQQELMIGFARDLNDDEIDALTTFLSTFKDDQQERYDIPFEPWGDGGS